MNITNITNPRWSTLTHTSIIIDCTLRGESSQFVASSSDCTDYGPEIYKDCIDGKYGEIAEYTPPIRTKEELESIAQAELDIRLNEVMTTENQALAEIDDEFRSEYKAMIKELLAVKKQKGWPDNIEWPIKPE